MSSTISTTQLSRMETLVERLNAASAAYYGGKEELMPNYEWDALFDELTALEAATGVVLPNSPTHNVSSEYDSDTPVENVSGTKEFHEFEAKSLAKSKSIDDLIAWAGDKDIMLSWKLDGLTLVVTYDNGKLSKIVTRGNGIVGTNITHMAGYITGIPLTIPYANHLVIRGEAVISHENFKLINADLTQPYSNSRNLAAGTMNLTPDEVHGDKAWRVRMVNFIPFKLMYIAPDADTTLHIANALFCNLNMNDWNDRLLFLKNLGFNPVDRIIIHNTKTIDDDTTLTLADMLSKVIQAWTNKLRSGECPWPVDGLVINYLDVPYSETGSSTSHHNTREGFAFKWPDTAAETTLRSIDWSCATNYITPVAVFDPVQLEGTTVTRASLVNISEMERLGIGKPDETKLSVIKANMIIPKVIKAHTDGEAFTAPSVCPVCGAPTRVITSENGPDQTVKRLICSNPNCTAKQLMKFVRFVSKDGLDIDGISIKTLEQLINAGFLKTPADLFTLRQHADAIMNLPGMGETSCNNLLDAIDAARSVPAVRFVKALSIPMIGKDAAKRIFDAIGYQAACDRLRNHEHFDDIEGIGSEKNAAIHGWFAMPENMALVQQLLQHISVKDHPAKTAETAGKCSGLTFVITGSVHIYENRNAFKAYVETNGGKVAGSVSKKTNFLVNNDNTSTSAKNVKANELGIPIITEDEFMTMFGEP